VTLRADRGGSVYFAQEAPADQPASTSVDYAAHTGSPVNNATAFTFALGLPGAGLLLRAGDRLSVVTTNLQAADQWSAIVAQLEEIPSGLPYQGDQLLLPPTSTLE
jgi:hypothetical protein